MLAVPPSIASLGRTSGGPVLPPFASAMCPRPVMVVILAVQPLCMVHVVRLALHRHPSSVGGHPQSPRIFSLSRPHSRSAVLASWAFWIQSGGRAPSCFSPSRARLGPFSRIASLGRIDTARGTCAFLGFPRPDCCPCCSAGRNVLRESGFSSTPGLLAERLVSSNCWGPVPRSFRRQRICPLCILAQPLFFGPLSGRTGRSSPRPGAPSPCFCSPCLRPFFYVQYMMFGLPGMTSILSGGHLK